MTTVTNPTFDGPNEGNTTGYDAGTLIESDPIDADLTAIETDLLYHAGHLQDIWDQVDNIWNDVDYLNLDADDTITLINSGTTLINVARLDIQSTIDSTIDTDIETHRTTVIDGDMHPMTAIQDTNLTYSDTPVSLDTTPVNLLDEVKNIRLMVHKVIGKTYWTDTPAKTIEDIDALFNVSGEAIAQAHADEHITGGSDIIDDAISGGASGLMTGTDKAKIDGIEALATQDQSAAEIAVLVDAESGINFLSDALLTKLGGIANYATIDQTADEIKVLVDLETDYHFLSNVLKIKLEGIATNANLYVHPTGDGNKHVPANGTSNEGNRLVAGASAGVYTWEPKPTTVIMNITEVSTSYNVLSTDYTIMATASSVNLSMNLPPAWIATGQIFQIKKMDSTEYAIVVHGAAGATIDGEITYDLLIQYEAVTVQSTGLNWIVL